MARDKLLVSVKLLGKKDYERFAKLYFASKEMLDNYTHWLDTGEVASEKESKRLYTNLKKAIETIHNEMKPEESK